MSHLLGEVNPAVLNNALLSHPASSSPALSIPSTGTYYTPTIMTCPTGCQCPESKLGAAAGVDKSRYFVGISPAVVFVASLSALAFFAVALGAVVVSATQAFFFFVLPLASAAGGAFLVAAPEMTPLGGADPTVLLLLRLAGGVAVAFAGSAMLVGRCGCPKAKSAHLALVAASLGAMSMALAADDSSALADGAGDRAAALLGRAAATAAASAVMTAAGPTVSRKLQGGKPAAPAVLTCS